MVVNLTQQWQSLMVEDWKKYYVNYPQLKRRLHSILKTKILLHNSLERPDHKIELHDPTSSYGTFSGSVTDSEAKLTHMDLSDGSQYSSKSRQPSKPFLQRRASLSDVNQIKQHLYPHSVFDSSTHLMCVSNFVDDPTSSEEKSENATTQRHLTSISPSHAASAPQATISPRSAWRESEAHARLKKSQKSLRRRRRRLLTLPGRKVSRIRISEERNSLAIRVMGGLKQRERRNLASHKKFWKNFLESIAKAEQFQQDQEEILRKDVKALKERTHTVKKRHADLASHRQLEMLDLQGAYILSYRTGIMLKNFATLNYLTTQKLLQLYERWFLPTDLHLPAEDQGFTATRLLKGSYFNMSKVPTNLCENLVKKYAAEFEDHSRDKAVAVLQTKMTDIRLGHWDSFRLGIKSAFVATLTMTVVLSLFVDNEASQRWARLTSPFSYVTYRSLGLIHLLPYMWSFDVHFWQKARINYVYVFEFNPRKRLTDVQNIELALNSTLVYLANFTLFLRKREWGLGAVRSEVFPITLWIYVLLQCFGPVFLVSKWRNNRVVLESLGQVIIAPFGRKRFLDTVIADVLTSTVKIIIDFYHVLKLSTLFFFPNMPGASWLANSSDLIFVPLLSALPLMFRFLQSIRGYYDTQQRWPNLINALKYAVAHSIVIAGSFHPSFQKNAIGSDWPIGRWLWLASTILSTIFTFTWDVTMDWGLWENGKMRKSLIFSHWSWHYWVMISNLILRFTWTLTLTPFSVFTDANVYQYVTVPLIAFLEIFRRYQWTLIRVEWEHIRHAHVGFQSAPVFFDNEREKRERARNMGNRPNLIVESLLMVIAFVLVGTLAAIM